MTRIKATQMAVVCLLLGSLLLAGATTAGAREPAKGQIGDSGVELALVSVNNPVSATAGQLLSSGIMVVRDMGRYLLVAARNQDLPTLSALGLEWTVLDSSTGTKTFYTVGLRAGAALADIEANSRVLRFDGQEAVIEASPDEAARIVGAGFDIARVFIRPIRVAPQGEAREMPAPAAPMAADPLIQQMVNAVSVSNINTNVQRLQDFKTRYATTDSCQAAANWVKAKFQSYGIDSVYFHHWSSTYKDNVVAVMPGISHPEKIVVIGGHFDSTSPNTSNCPGADDNATGTECVLEVARILSQYQFDYTITFITFCAEEQGLLGSEAYASEAAARGDQIVGMIGVDMIGYLASGDVMDLDIITNTASQWMRDEAFSVQDLYVPELPAVVGSLPSGASSDHASFWSAGYNAILFFEDSGQYSPYIHTTNDIVGLSYNSPTLALGSVKIAVGLVATMAQPFRVAIVHTPLSNTEDTQHPYPVVANITAAGTLNPDSLRVYYSTGTGWTGLTMT
ncbi:MAG TPA: M28 family peptidase, partial [bacterium]|nr:M28 family peptidase [bacterium]